MEALTRFGLPAIVAQAIDQGGPFLRHKPMAVVKLDHIEAHLRGGVLLRGLLDWVYWGRGLKNVKAVVPHASLCPSLVKSRWRNIMGPKGTFKRPCPCNKEAWDWTVLQHSTEEFVRSEFRKRVYSHFRLSGWTGAAS